MNVEELLQQAEGELTAGRCCVLATVIDVTGSTPAAPGFQMLVGERGRVAGTVGGGALEYAVERASAKMAAYARVGEEPLAMPTQVAALQVGVPGPHGASEAVRRFSLAAREAGNVGMVCGGNLDVLFTLFDAASVQTMRELLESGAEDAWMALPLDGGAPRAARDIALAGSCGPVDAEGVSSFALKLNASGVVYVFGAGHVGQALVPVLASIDFPCIVVDDRPDFADPALFPDAAEVRCLSFKGLAEHIAVRPGDRICVMTRGHAADADVLRFALGTRARYIGVMGSRRKREALFGMLEAEGYADVAARVHLPIGLPLGGRTAAEVAISIAAELIQDRAQG